MRNRNQISFNPKYPTIADLRTKAKKRIPRFAFEYLDGGCNDEINLDKNIREIQKVELLPRYLDAFKEADLTTELFGEVYDAPFGIAPVGLQGLMWPNSAEILAKAAAEHGIPFVLSTVTTSSIERISEITEGNTWFQLYHPTKKTVRNDLIKRAQVAGCPVLVLLCDTPVFGFRPKEIKNGLSMPPKMSLSNIAQILGKPKWAIETLRHGQPNFEVLKPYMPKGLNLKQLGQFMDQTFSKRMDMDKIAAIRDLWKGKLVLKGVATEADAEKAISLGLDGIVVSNHGGRQLDAAESSIDPMSRISDKYGTNITVMMDSGIRSGPDIARSLAKGAQFTFLGRSFMYGTAALGHTGGDHTISLLKVQLKQVMEQLGCNYTSELPHFLKPVSNQYN
ncbi:alpha-hydroxy acid oxidase [Flagellimonas marina]|uniref:Alpha-hydroxy-acid oxidizing protein n=1 Tax=Flagellimonas marina TaxID=1775168 RepID=A0ABV8PP23_9FLAO